MNDRLPLITGLLLAGLTALPARTFTSTKGHTMEGEIQDANDREVSIKRAGDGLVIKVPVLALSAEDQKEITAWRETKALGKLSVTATKDKVTSDIQSRGGSSSAMDTKDQTWSWVIIVKNGSAHPVRGLSLDWEQVVERTDRNQGAVSGRSKSVARRSSGKLEVPDIPAFGTVRVKTEPITVQAMKSLSASSSTSASGDRVTEITSYKWDETLSGLRVALLKGPHQVHVWKTGASTDR